MGRLASRRFPEARAVFERVDNALGMSISAVCFEGPAERLQETRWQQPAVFACSMALFSVWRSTAGRNDEIAAAAGHSLGEYGALVAGGAITLEDAAGLVALRGRLMQDASDRVHGGMSAVIGLDRDAVVAICEHVSWPEEGLSEIVVLANDNAPDQHVISGGFPALERAGQAARVRGARRVLPLKVAGAFHSPLMAHAVERLAEKIEQTQFNTCDYPVIANSTAQPIMQAADVRSELILQVTSPVLWVESVLAIGAQAPELWVDAGPGNVVAGLAARVIPDIDTIRLSTLYDADTLT
jgi:[acyl-carrier-protein] S-malonyltransferase